MRSAWFLLAVACSGTPQIASVSTPEVSGGQSVAVEGRGFVPGMAARLQTAGDDPVPLVVAVESRRALTARLPSWVRPGVYDLVLERAGEVTLAPGAVTVISPREEIACAGEYTANTELSLARAQVVIERYYRDGDRETVTVPLEQVTRIEYEMSDDAQGPCSAVFLRTDDGRRIVFHDDRTVDLRDRAWRVATTMGKELEVTRPDAAAMTDDDAATPE